MDILTAVVMIGRVGAYLLLCYVVIKIIVWLFWLTPKILVTGIGLVSRILYFITTPTSEYLKSKEDAKSHAYHNGGGCRHRTTLPIPTPISAPSSPSSRWVTCLACNLDFEKEDLK